jgi:transcriptional repressor NrdR
MRCPWCGSSELRVVDSRDSEIGDAIRRRRECLACGKRFTTYERIEALPFYVVKKDGRREDFDRNKLFTGLKKACEKRPISSEQIERIVDEIEHELRQRGEVEIPSRDIGELAITKLRDLDEVAYIRFASVYREFMDISEIKKEIDRLLFGRHESNAAGKE